MKEGRKGKKNFIFCRELWFPRARADVHSKYEDVCQMFLGDSR